MATLIVEAPPPMAPAQSPWAYALTQDGETVAQSGYAAVALLPRSSRSSQLVLVVPVQALSWQRTQLPQVSLKDRARVRAILAGLLEDQLLDDPAQMHFALEPDARAGAPCWVAACRSDILQGYLETLAAHGLQPQKIVPAFAPVPQLPGAEEAPQVSLVALGSEDAPWLVATGSAVAGGVLALPLTPAAAALDVVAAADAQQPVLAEPAVFQLAGERLGRPVELLENARRLLQASRSHWSLAQFQFANSSRDKLAQKTNATLQILWRSPQWRWARWGTGMLLLCNVAGLNIWAWQASADLAGQRARIDQVFRTTFPGVPVVIDAPLQMRQELDRLEKQTGAMTDAAFAVLAGTAGSGLPAGDLPTGIRYENGQLELSGLSQHAPAVQQWQAQLQARGLQSRWQQGNLLIEPSGQGEMP